MWGNFCAIVKIRTITLFINVVSFALKRVAIGSYCHILLIIHNIHDTGSYCLCEFYNLW